MKSLLIILAKLVFTAMLLIDLILCIPVLLLSHVVSKFDRRLSVKIATITSWTVWTIFDWIFRLSSEVEAPDIKKDNYLVISNHRSVLDFVLINSVNKKMFPYSKYAFKQTLRYVPIFYQGFILLKFLVLARNFELDKDLIEDYISDIKREQYPMWFVLFCEGTRLTEAKRQASIRFCNEKGIKPFKNVLAPRYKGFSIFHRRLRNSYIKKVLDLTFYCSEESFSLFNMFFTAKQYRFKCDVRIVDLNEIRDPVMFIEDAFRRKDELIKSWKK